MIGRVESASSMSWHIGNLVYRVEGRWVHALATKCDDYSSTPQADARGNRHTGLISLLTCDDVLRRVDLTSVGRAA